jgi:hypothetical protein
MELDDFQFKQLFSTYAKNNGYSEVPPTIEDFLTDDFYIGGTFDKGSKIFNYWKNELLELYPTPFFENSKYKVIVLSGSTGIGKCVKGNYEQEIYFDPDLYSKEELLKLGFDIDEVEVEY